jgi:hypothetical protein
VFHAPLILAHGEEVEQMSRWKIALSGSGIDLDMLLLLSGDDRFAVRKVDGKYILQSVEFELMNLCEEKPFYYRTMLEYIDASPEGRAHNPVLDEVYHVGERLNDDFAQIVGLGVAQGVFRDDLNVAPTGLILWSCLTSLISLLHNKRKYIESEMLSAQEFYDYAFNLLLRTVLKGGGAVE